MLTRAQKAVGKSTGGLSGVLWAMCLCLPNIHVEGLPLRRWGLEVGPVGGY